MAPDTIVVGIPPPFSNLSVAVFGGSTELSPDVPALIGGTWHMIGYLTADWALQDRAVDSFNYIIHCSSVVT